MAYFNVCDKCGATLDPGEKCDCRKEEVQRQDFFSRHLMTDPKVGQLAFAFNVKEVGHEKKTDW